MGLFDLFKPKDEKHNEEFGKTFVKPTSDKGAITVDADESGIVNYNASVGYSMDLNAIPSDDFELIHKYRNLAMEQEVDEAIQEIVNEAIISDDFLAPVKIVLDNVELSEAIKDKIIEQFNHVLMLLNFSKDGYWIFRKWYIDGRIYYHKVMNDSKDGLSALIPIDPLNITPFKEVKVLKQKEVELPIYDLKDVVEYYVYSNVPFTKENTSLQKNALKIPKDAISYIPSGLMSADNKTVLSYLYKAIKPFNNLNLLESSVVIYRVTRAPERRIFYVDVGNLPKTKAEQYLKDIMNRFKNKIVYDVDTGTVNNRKKFQSMIEDYWLPRREGGKGTEVSTLPGGEQLGELSDVEYFKTKLYKAMNVPLSRFQQDSTAFNLGRTTEISRDEIKFNKFINRERKQFSELFNDILRTQVVLQGIITTEEWDDIVSNNNSYSFLEDNYFAELKEVELLQDRSNLIQTLDGIVGKYISHDTLRKNILRQSEQDIKEEDIKIKEELKNTIFNPKDEDSDSNGFGR